MTTPTAYAVMAFIMVELLAFGIRTLAEQVGNEQSALQRTTSVWGISISGVFLVLIGLVRSTQFAF